MRGIDILLKKKWFRNLPLIFLILAITFSPSFSLGVIAKGRILELRVEDILLVIFGVWWLINFLIGKKAKIRKPPLFLPILIWLSIGFFSTLLNLLLGNVILERAFFYWLKEFEYFFLYFYVFYHVVNIDMAEIIVRSWIFSGIASSILIIFQLVTGSHYGTYGPSLFEEKGPLPSGGFFLILFAFLFNIFLQYYNKSCQISKIKKFFLFISISVLSIGVFASGSRTSVLGWFVVIVLTFFLNLLRQRGGAKQFCSGIIILVAGWGLWKLVSKKVPALLRMATYAGAHAGLSTRFYVWKNQLVEALSHPEVILFGLGKSVYLWTEESHSQYIRNFIETGIVGSFFFFFLIYFIIKEGFRGFQLKGKGIVIGLSAGLLVATGAMMFISIFGEAFLVVKIAEVYWFFVGLTMAVLYSPSIVIEKGQESV